jgi:hypothetical protein
VLERRPAGDPAGGERRHRDLGSSGSTGTSAGEGLNHRCAAAGAKQAEQKRRRYQRRCGRAHAVSCPVDELADRSARQPELVRDLVVATPLELAQHQRAALSAWKRVDRTHRPVQSLASLVGHVGALGSVRPFIVDRHWRDVPVLPGDIERRVDRDAMQPGPEAFGGSVAGQRLVRVQQRLLNGVLGGIGAQQAAAGSEQRLTVPVDQRLERLVAAPRGEPCERLVALQAQQRDAPDACRRRGDRLHAPNT